MKNKVLALMSTLILVLGLMVVPTTMRANADSLEVAFVGDLGCSGGKATIQALVNEHPSIVVLLGDLSYKSSVSCIPDYIKTLKNAGVQEVRCDVGNHDADEEENDKLEKAYWSICSPNHGFWSLTAGGLTIAGVNTQCDGSTKHSADKCDSKTIAGFLAKLEGNNLVTVTSHKSLCDSVKSKHGAYKCSAELKNQLNRLEAVRVAGHNHCDAFDGKGNFVAGSGGRSHYSCSGWSFTEDKTYGYLLLTINNNTEQWVFKNQKNQAISPIF